MPSDQFSYMLIHQINTKVNKDGGFGKKGKEIQSMRISIDDGDEDVWLCG